MKCGTERVVIQVRPDCDMGLDVQERDGTEKDTLELDGDSDREDDIVTNPVEEHLP